MDPSTPEMVVTKSGATQGMTGSYNINSEQQLSAVELSISYIRQAIAALDVSYSHLSPLIIADFGTAHGANSIYAMKTIIKYLRKIKKDTREPLIVHNDLPTNDWRLVSQLLAADNSYHGVACGRSFYEKCLPTNSLTIGYSSTSLQWLSRTPCNLSDHCDVEHARDPKEREAFKHQAYLDYCGFLKHRSIELIPGGVLILVMPGVDNQGHSGYEISNQLLYECAQSLPLTPKELLDYTMPSYCRSHAECIDEKLFAECSLHLITSSLVSVESPLYRRWHTGQITLDEFVRTYTSSVRSWSESVLEQALINNGREKDDVAYLLDQFYTLYERETRKQPDVHVNCGYSAYIILKKKPICVQK